MLNLLAVLEESSNYSPTVNDKLIKEIAKGNMEALHTLYEKTNKSIYAYALSITKDPHDAEDILQETFLKIY